MCTFGLAPSSLTVLPTHRTNGDSQPAANIMDHIPMVNIMPFGMCNTPTNPQVAAATAAAMGALTPQPCIPVVPAPWMPGAPQTMIDGAPALNQPCTCMCQWGGVISITVPGEMTINVE
jgi:hypothetical protein